MYTIFEGYSYSRPVSYRSYYPRHLKPFVLKDHQDPESDAIRNILTRNKQTVNWRDSLARGIKWDDWVFGKRYYNHHPTDSLNFNDHHVEYYIHQWKPTNHLANEHPVGSHKTYRDFKTFEKEVEKLVTIPPWKLDL